MKKVPLKVIGQFNPILVIRGQIAPAPDGITIEQIRRRCRILDVLEKAEGADHVLMEDADYEFMVKTLKASKGFGVADRNLLAVLDAVFDAPDVAPNELNKAAA